MTNPTVTHPCAIDPLGALVRGRYCDDIVTVCADAVVPPRHHVSVVRTKHFEVWTDGRLFLRHRLRDDQIDDSLTTLLDQELFSPGWVVSGEAFERLFTGIVRTTRPDAVDAWSLFYRNSRLRLAPLIAAGPPVDTPLDALQEFGAIYAKADALVPRRGTILELGSCFGFLALHLARVSTRDVTASDIAAGSMQLLDAMARHLSITLRTLVCDAARIPRPDGSVDTVVMTHLLEHLDARQGLRAIAEATRVARHRVVIAVPYEEEANPAFGHVRTIDAADLRVWGRAATGFSWTVEEHHGGWLVLDRQGPDAEQLLR